ncbi:hypothetical protein M758_11G089600 [Ceratodon purpureus]|nr:hypothetical protein M758_11G089600 [Ceratodon purpureus]
MMERMATLPQSSSKSVGDIEKHLVNNVKKRHRKVDIEEHLVKNLKKRQKKVERKKRELHFLLSQIAKLYESFSVPTFPEGYDADTGIFRNAVIASDNLNENIALETVNNTSSISSAYAPDSTVSNVRHDFLRAMQRYEYHINKAKTDRAKEGKEGPAKRGLECRPDIVAYNEMKKARESLNPEITVGYLPGIDIGDIFTYRHQMAAVGLHRLPNAGIDYGTHHLDMIPIAGAIVLVPKAGYVDDMDYGNIIHYTGQGGRKKHSQASPVVNDQVLKKGNLALSNNRDRKLPVRVIRGHSALGSTGAKLLGYTYDGLYRITGYSFSLGLEGFKVYKYSLQRLEDQPPIPPCIPGCTAHEWNNTIATGAVPLQEMDPFPAVEGAKHH